MVSNLFYLIPILRVKLWDIVVPYRYLDEWLDVALIAAIKSLQRWWSNKYLVDSTNLVVSRNPDITFTLDEPPVIETSDERVVILMASILVKEGTLENSAWSTATWRDAEYYVSNIEGTKTRESGLKRDWDELLSIIKPPQKRLNAGARESFNFGADETT
jgi:hypothetical protein